MKETNNFTFKVNLKIFCVGSVCCWPKKRRNKLEHLKFWALFTGLMSKLHSTSLFLIAVNLHYLRNLKPDRITSLTSINETKTNNLTANDALNQNLKNSTSVEPGFSGICGIMLYTYVLLSFLMFLHGVKKECKNLLLPYMISGPTIMIGLMISFQLYPCYKETQGSAIYHQISGVYLIICFMLLFLLTTEYFGLLTERDRVKKAVRNSRPIPPDVLNATER